MQPRAEICRANQSMTALDQHEKDRLKRILGIGAIGQGPTTRAPNQGTMPADEFREIGFRIVV
jgi:hypothetical protein